LKFGSGKKKGEFDIDDDLSIGDILYCINNKGVERDLKLGENILLMVCIIGLIQIDYVLD